MRVPRSGVGPSLPIVRFTPATRHLHLHPGPQKQNGLSVFTNTRAVDVTASMSSAGLRCD
jgi:hypothetical protein